MKLWVPARIMPSGTNLNRTVFSYTLHFRHRNRILLCNTHLPRCKLWVINPKHTRKRSIILLHLHLCTYRPRTILRIIPLQGNMNHRGRPSPSSYDNCLCRIRPTMGANVILRGHCHY